MLIFSLLLPWSVFAGILNVHGQEFSAHDIGYYVDSSIVHSFTVDGPVAFPFAQGNSLRATDTVFLHKDGNISALLSVEPQRVKWNTGNLQLDLDCGGVPEPGGLVRARVINFYPNRNYQRGCNLVNPVEFESDRGRFLARGSLDLSEAGDFKYAREVSGEILLPALGDRLPLVPGTEVDFHDNGNPHFFTPARDFPLAVEGYGPVLLGQRAGRAVSFIFYPDGSVERALLGQDLKHAQLRLTIPAGSGVIFDESKILTDIIFRENFLYPVQGYDLKILQFSWDRKTDLYTVVIGEEFFFVHPDTGRFIQVPVGSQVGINPDGVIIGIRVPRGSEDGGEAPALPGLPRL